MSYPLVTVIIPTYLDHNDMMLQDCLKALNKQDVPLEVIVVSDRKTTVDLSAITNHQKQLIKLDERVRFSAKNNMAVKASSPHSKYFLLLNDDTLPTRGMIRSMVETIPHESPAMLGTLSNCDVGPLYHTTFEAGLGSAGKMRLPNQFNHSEAAPFLDHLFEYRPYTQPFAFETPRLFFYNVMIPRKVYEMVGPLEEGFQNSCEDFDYCIRAKKLGIKLYIQQNAFCFHFSGKTSSLTATMDERVYDQQFIERKHGADYWRVG